MDLKCRAGVRRFSTVTLPDGATVRLRSLLRSEHRQWLKATTKPDGSEDAKLHSFSDDVLLAMSIVDDKDQLIFTKDEALSGVFDTWDSLDVRELIGECIKLSVVRPKTAVGDALKNSNGTPGNDSSGDSSPTQG